MVVFLVGGIWPVKIYRSKDFTNLRVKDMGDHFPHDIVPRRILHWFWKNNFWGVNNQLRNIRVNLQEKIHKSVVFEMLETCIK